ncbi:MAG: universal stress protein [Actinomycetota bacterium]|nr:universal stress protein [Actinomycetota bacterium]
MDTVIVGVDASDASRRATEFAATRAAQLGLSLVLVHVIPWSPYSFSTPGENERRGARKKEEIEAASTQVIAPLLELLAERDVEVETVVRHGDPVDLLVYLVGDLSALQVVVGRTGDSRVRQAIFGSIPGHLVQVSPVPVTVVP